MFKKVSNELVQSTDNSWIECKSKSYADRMYYFNTVTGTSVWNLSEPEIQYAKRSSNFLRKSNNFLIDNCPEPSYSPTDNEYGNKDIKNHHNVGPSKRSQVYNEQIINDKSTRTHHNFQPMKPMQYGISVPQMYNPLIDQADYGVKSTLNVSETFIPVSETFLPLSSQNESRSDINYSKLSPFNISDSREILNNRLSAVNSECYNRNNETFKTKCDLREILSERRKKSSTNVKQFQSMISDASISECPNSEDNNVPLDMSDEEWLLDNTKLNRYNLNTCKLRNIANLDTNTELWIVTDTNVLLSNTIFLTVLLHSDKQCHLIMPYAVLEEIKGSGKSHLNCQAKKALHFISQQIHLNRLIIDIDRLDENTLAIEDEILGCCSRLLVQGVPFVLLTNNRAILHIKERVTFPIFTIIEIKMLSCYQFYPKSNTFSSPLNINEASIKVTIPNVPQVPIASPRKDTSYIVTDDHIPAMANIDEVEVNITDQTAFCEPNITKNVTESVAANTNINGVITGNKNKIELKRNILIDASASKEKWHIKRAKALSEKANESNTTKSTHTLDDNSIESQISEYKNFEPVRIKAANLNSSMRKPPIERDQTPKNPESSKEEKNVMFEISSKSMEDNLRTKCDEWVSRFTQIMEEMLTQVLLKEPKFACEAIPPPWSLYEAVECTKRKFHSDGDVVDATNKFCSVLFDIGASRGKVKSTISPKQYMDLYSYGVYLSDALQGVLNDCEDLQTASELLARLLKEIQDPHIDINTHHLDLCSNAIDKESEKVVELNVNKNERKEQGDKEKHLSNEEKLDGYILKELPQCSVRSDECQVNDKIFKTPKKYKRIGKSFTSPPKYDINAVAPISPSKYNLRSSKRKKLIENIVQDPEIPEFFDSLRLMRRTTSGVDLNKRDEELNTEGLNNEENANEQLLKNNDKNKVSTDTNAIEEKNIEPKVVRNIVKSLDLEERSQKKNDFTNHDDQENEESVDEANNGMVKDIYPYRDDYFYGYGEDEDLEEVDNIKRFLEHFINKTKRALSVVFSFCKKSHDVLRSPQGEHHKSDILLEAHETKVTLTKICETLESILKRETSDSEDSILGVFKKSKINCGFISDEQMESYRNVISKFLEQGNILMESITCIIDVINV